MDIARFIGVEDILRGLHARARTVPELGARVFGADEEVEGVFDGRRALFCTVVLVGGGWEVERGWDGPTYRLLRRLLVR